MPRSKYRAVATVVDGIRFASRAEARRWSQLKLLERAGEISGLTTQPKYTLTEAKITYKADFAYRDRGVDFAEDVKGVVTERFRLIKKLWKHYGPCTLRVTKSRGNGFIVVDEVEPINSPLVRDCAVPPTPSVSGADVFAERAKSATSCTKETGTE